MSFILNKKAALTDGGAQQYRQIEELRRIAINQNKHLQTLTTNAIPDLAPKAWLEMDNTTVQLIGQEADVIYQDLMPLSKSVGIGTLVSAYRRLGAMDAGEVSLSGQTTKLMGQVADDYDGVVIPIHSKSFGFQWREFEGKRQLPYDIVAENQAAATREVIRLMTNTIMVGNPGINYQGFGSYGIRTSPNTLKVVLGADFTAPATTFEAMDTALGNFLYNVRGPNNRVVQNGTLYISSEIEKNWGRRTGPLTTDQTYMAALGQTPGVSEIKTSLELSGNEMLFIIRSTQFIQPITGMAVTNTPIPRLVPMADYHYLTWSAMGLAIKADQDGRTGVLLGTAS